jgi:asparagine synthase (glutamine-hydrolysing)
MGAQLARRGPDDEQLYDDGTLALVFRRLSIIDLAGGRQPLWNERRDILAVVNGEIYNHDELRNELQTRHTFRTRSDSETVLHLYEEEGPRALDRLLGMFALAIWDLRQRRLLLARDRLGIKPLYLAETKSGLLFGSELKALLPHPSCPRKPRWRDLNSLTDRRATFVEGVTQLPGGCYATWSAETKLRVETYWAIDRFFPEPGATVDPPPAYVDRYAELFSDSVRHQLMSDVPVGAFLSGGIDSSLVVAAAAPHSPELHCFNVLERGTFLSGDARAAWEVARRTGVRLHAALFEEELPAVPFDLSTFEYFVWLLDAPRFDLEWFYKHELHRFARSLVPQLKVILLGQGADEFAGGYSTPLDRPRLSWEQYLHEDVAATLSADTDAELGFPSRIEPFLRPRTASIMQPDKLFQAELCRSARILQVHNLWHEDRTGAAQGIEARFPYLDHRLVELLASVPVELHAQLFWDKSIVRAAAERWLPPTLTRRAKGRFFVGRGELASAARTLRALLSRAFPGFRDEYLSAPGGILAPDAVLDLWARVEHSPSLGHLAALAECMAIAVFDRLVDQPDRDPPRGLDPPSPLRPVTALTGSPWGLSDDADVGGAGGARPGEQQPSISAWGLDERPVLAPGLRVLRPLGPPNGALVFANEEGLEQEVDAADGMEWIVPLFERLAAPDPAPTTAELVELLLIPLDDLRTGLSMLLELGLIVPDRPSILPSVQSTR